MTTILLASAGLAIAGVPGALIATAIGALGRFRRQRISVPPMRSVLLVVLVELRSGMSTLAALQQAAIAFPDHPVLVRGSRVATVDGLTAAIAQTSGEMKGLFTQLARAQRSGAPSARAVRSLLESDIAFERARRLRRARSLPIKLMLPISLLLLPGLMLVFYAPSLLRLLGDLTGPFT